MKSRYFVPNFENQASFTNGADHVRVDLCHCGRNSTSCAARVVWVFPNGNEVELPEQDKALAGVDMPAFNEAFKEVHPQSSDSLRRSHRYAEKYGRGKRAGQRQALEYVANELSAFVENLREQISRLDPRVDDASV